MATPISLRDAVATLTRQARRDLFALWDRLSRADQVEEALRDVLPTLIEQYGIAASALAADWYDDIRADAGAPGRFQAIPAAPTDAGAQALIGWAVNSAADDESLRVLVDGGMQKRIANASRATVIQSTSADPAAVGWKRIGSGACAFCRMLIERNETYRAETADFASHDHCKCQAYPLIKGAEPVDVKDYVRSSRYIEDDEQRAKANARVREWIAKNL